MPILPCNTSVHATNYRKPGMLPYGHKIARIHLVETKTKLFCALSQNLIARFDFFHLKKTKNENVAMLKSIFVLRTCGFFEIWKNDRAWARFRSCKHVKREYTFGLCALIA